ncbi:MAG: YqgE/AlgH family protein [Rhodospirillales bacterium]|nr:YqgE/AlgH family protein [Rhodospirillales bacterium]MDH3913599.1 YqgE/AlgH family protein [Rhodospirillales bacterium]
MSISSKDDRYLTGQLLIAMPNMLDPRFTRTVIYLCAHTEDAAMGLVVNRLNDQITFPDLLEQLDIDTGDLGHSVPIHFGGPVESGRGFVLHSPEYQQEGTLKVSEGVSLTATVEILRDMAVGKGPQKSLLALGYAGWGRGQLDAEIQSNSWLHVDPDDALVFGGDLDEKWEQAIAKLGFDFKMLSGDAGHA